MSNQPVAVATLYFKLRNDDGYYQLRCETGPQRLIVHETRWPTLKHWFSASYWHTHFSIDRQTLPPLVKELMGLVQPWPTRSEPLTQSPITKIEWEIGLSLESHYRSSQQVSNGTLRHATDYVHRSGKGAVPPEFQQLLTLITAHRSQQ
ncbi:hypothetical protein RA086_04455 [Lactiplantibacillus sp. WILCCON 0030]|uniref:Uncharacterized protein n=1 Tax=Lactiplantibacillus brownii TaxID=3069269 RepID=A0ABU1A7H8_9LACO|nr:hypothetical protein [Lactiplantibacillus brownii]MDQ7936893.1 hypothetical protein [Lactiplantibacillus brownii]